ncbi:MAG TPA: hypothetical protein PKY01_11860 [Candidatus Hydrogenedentes bacterium]|nr:hypothetical protein [Candidatus Hydrogenedentota bacterium]
MFDAVFRQNMPFGPNWGLLRFRKLILIEDKSIMVEVGLRFS